MSLKCIMFVIGAASMGLSGCQRFPVPGDTTPPTISVNYLSGPGIALVVSTDPSQEGDLDLTTCGNGTTGTQVPNNEFALPAGQPGGEFLFGFADASGIRSAQFSMAVSRVTSIEPAPEIETVNDVHGDPFDAYVWRYDDPTAPFQTPVLTTIDYSPAPGSAAPYIAISATDGAGNVENHFLRIARYELHCD